MFTQLFRAFIPGLKSFETCHDGSISFESHIFASSSCCCLSSSDAMNFITEYWMRKRQWRNLGMLHVSHLHPSIWSRTVGAHFLIQKFGQLNDRYCINLIFRLLWIASSVNCNLFGNLLQKYQPRRPVLHIDSICVRSPTLFSLANTPSLLPARQAIVVQLYPLLYFELNPCDSHFTRSKLLVLLS